MGSDAVAGVQSRAYALPAHYSRGANILVWTAHEHVRGVPHRLLGSNVHAERPRLLLPAPSAVGIPKGAKDDEQQQQRGEQQERKRGRPARTPANRRARLIL